MQTVQSSTKGRVRFKVSALYRCLPLQELLTVSLIGTPGVKSVEASVLTGSVLIHYNSGSTVEPISELVSTIVRDFERNHGLVPRPQSSRACDGSSLGQTLTGLPSQIGGGFLRLVQSLTRSPQSCTSDYREQTSDPWHIMQVHQVLDRWGVTAREGLSSEHALKNLAAYGPNSLPESKKRSGLSIFAEQFNSLPVAMLGVTACVSIVTGGLADAAVIMGVVLINASIGFVTERESERTIDSLKHITAPMALVVRDGLTLEIPMEDVVPGDILVLKPGIYVAADARVVEAHNLTIDESSLTGESLPVTKSRDVLMEAGVSLADRRNMAYMGTLVTGGQGLAVVVACGCYTQMGQLHFLVGEAVSPETPMERQLGTMGSQLVFISSAVCGVVFVIGIVRGYGLLEMFKTAISLAVAAVPEGLTAVATTTLALGIREMKSKNVLIRHLAAVETLGAVQTMCFDKTGTVTENKMTVRHIRTNGEWIEVDDGQFKTGGVLIGRNDHDRLARLFEAAALCSETHVKQLEDRCVLKGSPTENALINMAICAGLDVKAFRKNHPLLETRLRTEDRHFMATLHQCADGRRLVAVKGSPTEVLDLCSRYWRNGVGEDLTEEDRASILTANGQMAGEALRVLGFAFAHGEDGMDVDALEGLTWLGLVGMADPVRKGVKELMAQFHEAGIETVMITGDQTPTAYAIGKELNLSNGRPMEILDSTHLNNLRPDALQALADKAHVFSRVSPANKLQIVQAFQSAGKVVAMTGDGINDSPALKAADIGVSLGSTGTDIAREVADVILENDNLETMIIAVGHGRTIYDNIRKSLHFLLATNFSEIMVMFLTTAVGLGHPLSPMQLLWINLISDIFPGLALALEPPEPEVLKRPPRDPEEPIIRKQDFSRMTVEASIMSAAALGAYGYGLSLYGPGAKTNTLTFQTLSLAQLLHAFSCRSESHTVFERENSLPPNKYLNSALGVSIGIQILTSFVAPVRTLLGLAPVGMLDVAVIGAGAAASFLANELTKKVSRDGSSRIARLDMAEGSDPLLENME